MIDIQRGGIGLARSLWDDDTVHLRYALDGAGRHTDWPRSFELLSTHRAWVNSSRLGRPGTCLCIKRPGMLKRASALSTRAG